MNYTEIKSEIIDVLYSTYRNILEENIEKNTGVYVYTDCDARIVHIHACNDSSRLRNEYNVICVHKWDIDEYTWRDYARIYEEPIPSEQDDPQAYERLREEEVHSVLCSIETDEEFEEWADNAIEQLKNKIGA